MLAKSDGNRLSSHWLSRGLVLGKRLSGSLGHLNFSRAPDWSRYNMSCEELSLGLLRLPVNLSVEVLRLHVAVILLRVLLVVAVHVLLVIVALVVDALVVVVAVLIRSRSSRPGSTLLHVEGEEQVFWDALRHGVNHVSQLVIAVGEAAHGRKFADSCLLPVAAHLSSVVTVQSSYLTFLSSEVFGHGIINAA